MSVTGNNVHAHKTGNNLRQWIEPGQASPATPAATTLDTKRDEGNQFVPAKRFAARFAFRPASDIGLAPLGAVNNNIEK
jgi:hypothetical protein